MPGAWTNEELIVVLFYRSRYATYDAINEIMKEKCGGTGRSFQALAKKFSDQMNSAKESHLPNIVNAHGFYNTTDFDRLIREIAATAKMSNADVLKLVNLGDEAKDKIKAVSICNSPLFSSSTDHDIKRGVDLNEWEAGRQGFKW